MDPLSVTSDADVVIVTLMTGETARLDPFEAMRLALNLYHAGRTIARKMQARERMARVETEEG
jgi:hypothetical protein